MRLFREEVSPAAKLATILSTRGAIQNPAAAADYQLIPALIGSVIFAPAIETILLVVAVRETRRKSSFVFLASIFTLFSLLSLYLIVRLSSAKVVVCWSEGYVAHACHNGLAVFMMVVDQRYG